MATRKKIGILFNFSPKWLGGVIYVLNAIKVLNFLEEQDKPMIFVFYNPNLQRFVDEIDYPYIEKIAWSYPSVYKQFLKSLLLRKNTFVAEIIDHYKLDTIFPLHDFPARSSSDCKLISWYADLQHLHYPHFFSLAKRFERYLRVQFILKNASHLVVSSQAVKEDFYRFFKIPKSMTFEIYHFVSIIDAFPTHTLKELQATYELPDQYFIISNQFHKHKNHKVVFEAVAELKKRGTKINVVLTGKLPDDSNSDYVEGLKRILEENQLEDQILFLGVLPRDIQLSIMKHAEAIVQPSLFEGWSTVIEDAIALQKPVICSDIPVNVEQLKEKGFYFSAENVNDLCDTFTRRAFAEVPSPLYESYDTRVRRAAKTLHKILTE